MNDKFSMNIDDIILIMKKQKPQKPKYVNTYEGFFECPRCHSAPMIRSALTLCHYCSYCGQRLDWSEVNDDK